jgi:peptidoglycan/LPS O-acetylase OafA/YrhL
MQRHFGLDWLRVGAFAILILYHVGMVFVPWDFHMKLPGAWWVAVPMMASNPWRLALLFVVSGYASRALLARRPEPLRFAWQRTVRLIVPLIFGVAVIVPVQPWIELSVKYGYPHGFAWFWAHDYFGFHRLARIDLPTWNHLWFVGYLWAYTLLLALAIALTPARVRGAVQRAFDWSMRGPALLLIPMAWMVVVNLLLFPGARETHALLGDWVAHASYFPPFLFGFALAAAPATIASFVRGWKLSAAIALLSYALVAGIEIRWPGNRFPAGPWGAIFSITRAVEGWAAIAALIGFADSHWNRDHPWRRTLTEAVFPFYIVHQSVIVLVAWLLRDNGWPAWVDFVVLVAATVAGCWAFYLIGRSIGPLRPLIGLRRHAKES